MNTNRDASQRTKYNNAKTLARYYQARIGDINAGTSMVAPGSYSDISARTYTETAISKTECCIPTNLIINSSVPTYTTYYVTFTTTGANTWTVPAACQSPITYWIIGGGGGGAGAFDQRGNGGGGGGASITGTYPVVAGSTYTIVVGAGGAAPISTPATFAGQGQDSYIARGATTLLLASTAIIQNDFSAVPGGQASTGIGAVRYSGGASGANFGRGGGGASGYSGNGGNGGAKT
jgi:hypothetical protein